jgi:DNA-directed RNA polymerase subunit H (RpoH/RPB5)
MSGHCREYAIHANVLKYLDIIGYKVEGKSGDSKLSVEEVVKTLQFYTYLYMKASNKDGGTMYIFILGEDSILSGRSGEFKKLLSRISEKKAKVLVISSEGLGATVLKFLDKYNKKKLEVIDLTYKHFRIDPRANTMVPKHELCTEEEVVRIMKDNSIDDIWQFPIIRQDDPQVIWLGATRGQLLRIQSISSIGHVLYYRVVL